ncbi:MAG: prepilin-type N-terminal cleavage/methylation domain-containing protein [Planctomycetes bacterium]|nr:prepilin-type N-terminal cleavage/methylation domain-containing protein [Planctomycetota bacterium]
MRCALSGRTKGSRAGQRAFTLVELLVVITIIGLLMTLLLPVIASAWRTAEMTHCKTNLFRLYEAYGVWRSDNDGRILDGASWMGRLMPYVEFDTHVFQCKATAVSGAVSGGDTTGSTPGEPGSEGSDGSDDPWNDAGYAYDDGSSWSTDGMDTWAPSSDDVDACFEFDVYSQLGSALTMVNGELDVAIGQGKGSHLKGEFLRSIPLGGHAWVDRQDKGGYTHYAIDDAGTGIKGHDDLALEVYYDEDGQPNKIQIISAPGANTDSVSNRYYFDFKGYGEVIISDWVAHYNETIILNNRDDWGGSSGTESSGGSGASGYGGGAGGSQWYWDDKAQAWRSRSPVTIVFGDYALSRGTFDSGQRTVTGVDPKLFFILDYAYSKPLADFNEDGTEDEWDKYFIRDTDQWLADHAATSGTIWQRFQALRHFGKANVLFCDGHVDTLGWEELYQSNPLWRYQGR